MDTNTIEQVGSLFLWRLDEVWAVHGNLMCVPVWLVTAHVSSLLVHGEGREISGPYLHSYSGFPVPQLWSRRNDKHYRGAEVTEGAQPELLLFSHKWNRWCLLGLVGSEPWRRHQMQLPSGSSVLLLQVFRSILTGAWSRQLKVPIVSDGPGGFGGKSV